MTTKPIDLPVFDPWVGTQPTYTHNSSRSAFASSSRPTPSGPRWATLGDSPDLLARASLPKRISVALATSVLTIAELAEHLSTAEDTIGRIVRRMRGKGQVVQVGDAKPHRWGLAVR